MANPKIVFTGVDQASVVVGKVAGAVDKLKLALTGLGAAVAVDAFKGIVNDLDKLDKSAQSAGVAVETLSALRYAASFAGIGAEDLDEALKKLNVQLAAAGSGSKDAAEIFKRLGISVKNSSGQILSSDEALSQIADKFAQYRDGPEKAAAAVELFGRSGTKLIPFLNQGAAGLEAMKVEAERLGIVIGGDATTAASKFNDQLERLSASSRANAIDAFLPLITALSRLVEEFDAARRSGQSFFETLKFTTKYFNLSEADAARAIADINQQLERNKEKLATPGARDKYIRSKLEEKRAELELEKKALQQIQAARRVEEVGKVSSNEGYKFQGAFPGKRPDGASQKEEIDATREALAKYIEELDREIAKLEDLTAAEKTRRLLRANSELDTAQVREVVAGLERQLDLRQRAAAAKKEDIEGEAKVLAAIKATDDQLDAFSGRAADALKIAQTARLEARLAAGEIFSPEELEKTVKGIAGIKDEVEKVSDAAKDLALQFASSIGQFIEDPKQGSFFKALGKDIEKLIVQMLIVKPLAEGLEALFNKSFGGGSAKSSGSASGGILSAILGFFGGFFADGGTLGRGQWGVAGERGPELIYGGSSGMTVLPAGAGRGSATVNVYIDGATDRARIASYVEAGVSAGLARSADSRARGGSGVR